MTLFLQGYGLGMTLAILVGPLLFMILQNTLDGNIRSGFMTVTGIWLSDLAFIFLVYFFLYRVSSIIESPEFEMGIGTIGGLVLIIIGVIIFLNKNNPLESTRFQNEKADNLIKSFTQGFVVNTLSPFTVVFWVSVISGLLGNQEMQQGHYIFLGGIMAAIVTSDTLKVYFANHIKKKLSLQLVRKVSKISGAAIAVFGIVLILRTVL